MKKITAILSALAIMAGLTVMSSAADYLGDVDKNGKVDSADALAILEYSVGKTNSIDKTYADTNNDGAVNSADALEVLNISVGKSEAKKIEASEPVFETKEDIVNYYNKVIDEANKSTATVTSSENVEIKIDSVSGGKTVQSLANSLVSNYAKPTTTTESFTNGACNNTANQSDIGTFTACKSIDNSGVADATITKNGDGYIITLTVVSEKSSLNEKPKYNSQCSRPLDLASVDLSGVTVTKADFTYSGTILKVTVGADGKVTSTDVTMPLAVSATGKLSIVSLNAEVSGTYTNQSNFVY